MPNTTQPGPHTQNKTQDRVGLLLKRMTLAQIGLESLDHIDEGTQQTLLSTHQLAEKISRSANRLGARAMTLDPLKGLPKFLNLVQERSLPLAIDTSFAQGPQAAKGPRSPSDVGPWQDWINAVYLMLFDEDEDADEAGAKKPQYSRQQVRQAVAQRIAAQKQVIPGVSPEERAKQERAPQVPASSLEALLARLPGSMRPEVTAKAKGFLGATDQERESLFQHVERLGSMSALVARLDEVEAKGVSGRAGAEIGAAAGVVGQAGAAAAAGVVGQAGARATSAGVLGARGRLPGVLGVQALGVGAQHVGRLSEGAAKMSPAVASPVSARAMRPMVAEAGEGEMGFKLSAVFDALGESALGIAQWVDSAMTSREGYRTEVSGSLLALLPEGEVEGAYRQVSAAPGSKVSASTRLQDVTRLERLEQLKLEQARVERLRLEQLRAENLKVVGAEELRRGGMKSVGEPTDLLGRLRQLVQSPTAAGQLMQWLSDAPTAKLLAGVQLEKGSPAMGGGLEGLAPLGALNGVQAAVRVGERSATMGEAAGQGVIGGFGRGAERMSVAYALQKVLQRAQVGQAQVGQAQAGQAQAGQAQAGQAQAGQAQAGQAQAGQAWLGQSAAVRAGVMSGVAPAGQRSSVALFGDMAVDGRYLGSLSRGLDVAADSEQRYSRFMSEVRVGGRVGQGLERSDSGAYARNMFEQGTLLSGVLEGEAASEPVKARQRTAETGLTKQAIESLRKMGISAVSLSEILPGLSEVIEQQRQLSQRAFQLQNPDVRVQIAPNAAEPVRKTASGLPITNSFTATSAVMAVSGLQAALQQALTVALEKQKNVGLSQPGALAAMAPHGLSASALKALSGQARVAAGESSMSSLRLMSAEPSHLLRMVDRLQDQVFVGQVAVDKAYVSALGASLELVSSVDGRAERFDAGRVTAQQTPEAMVGRTNQMLSLVHAPDVTAAMTASRAQRDAKGVMASQGAGVGVAAGAEAAALTRDANRAADAMLPAPMMKAMERLGVKVMRLSDVVPGLSELVRQEKVQGLDGGTLTGQRHLRSLQKQAEQALKQTNSAAFASQDEGTQRAVQALVQQVTQLKQSMHLGDLGRMQGVERAISKLAMEFVQSGGRPEVAAEISRTLGALSALNQEGVGSAGAAPIKAQAAKSIGAIERLEALLSERALVAAAAGVRGASLSAAKAQGALTLRSGIGSPDKVSLRAQAAVEGGLTLRHSAGALMELVSQKGLQATGARQQLSLDVKRRGYAALEPVTERFVPSLMMSQGEEKVADGHRRSQALSAEFGLPETGELIRVSYSPDTLEAMVEARQQKQMSRESVVTGRSSFDLALKRVLKDRASSPQDIAKALERSLPGLVVQSATANQASERALVQGEQRRAADIMRRVGLRLHQAQLETQRSNRSAYIDVSADWERAWVSVFAPKVSPVKGEPVGGAKPAQRFGMEEPAKVASSGVFSPSAVNELRMDVPELSLVQLAQASRQADARAQVGGGDVQQRAAAAASMGQVSVSQSRLGQLSGWSGLSGALSDSVLAKVGTTQRAGAGRGEQALVQPTQRPEAERSMRAAEARVSERLSRSLKQAEAVQLNLNAEVGQLFSIGTGLQAQQHGARFDDTQMLSRIERLLDQAQAVGGQHERAALSQSDMLVLKLGSGQGKQPDTREDGLPAWRKKSEHVQGVEVGELREMLQKVGALPVQGGKVSAERQLVNPFVAAAPKPYDVEAHSPLFSGGEASASGSSGESASASSGSPLAPSMPSYDQMVKLSDRVYKFIMKKLRQDLNRY